MSKRFMVDDAGTLIDMVTGENFDIVEEVCPLLNGLHEENENLQDFAKHNYSETKKIINNLQEENEQLKKDREELFIRERDTKNEWRELKQENEQLKQLLDYADDLIQSYMSVHNRDEWENVKKNITGDVE